MGGLFTAFSGMYLKLGTQSFGFECISVHYQTFSHMTVVRHARTFTPSACFYFCKNWFITHVTYNKSFLKSQCHTRWCFFFGSNLHCNRTWGLCCCCCSVAESWATLYNPMECSVPGSSVLHCLLEFGQIHVLEFCSDSLSQWYCLTIWSSAAPLFCLQSFSASGSFSVRRLFASGGPKLLEL